MPWPRSVRRSAEVLTLSEPSHVVRLVEPAELPRLAAVVGRSLIGDPIFQWAFGGSATAQVLTEFSLRLYAQPAELGMMWETGEGRAVAVWVPPGGHVVDSSGTSEAETRGHDVPGTNPEETWSWIESFVPDDSWYLEVLGVDSSAQGVGLGSALVRHGLMLAAEGRAGAFLETSVASNVRYYERFGFVVVDEADMPGAGPHVWFMRVDP